LQEAATENYERHGHANSPEVTHYFWSEAEWERALVKNLACGTRTIEPRAERRPALRAKLAAQHSFSRRCGGLRRRREVPTRLRWHGLSDCGEPRRTRALRRYLPRIRSSHVLGETEEAAAGFTAESATESAALVLVRAPFAQGVSFPEAKVTIYGNATSSTSRHRLNVRAARFAPADSLPISRS